MAEASHKTMTIAKRHFKLGSDRVERALREALPDPITSHYVVIGKRRYPPKQAISSSLDWTELTSPPIRRGGS